MKNTKARSTCILFDCFQKEIMDIKVTFHKLKSFSGMESKGQYI